MDDGLSSFVPENLDFDVGSVSHVDVEAQNAADALKREKQLDEDLVNAFDDLADDEDGNSDSSDNDSNSDTSHNDSNISNEESVNSSQNRSQAEQSYIKQSYEHSGRQSEANPQSSIIQPELPSLKQHSIANDSEIYHPSDVNHSEVSDVNYSYVPGVNHSNSSDVSYSGASDAKHSSLSIVNHSDASHLPNANILSVNHSHVSRENQSDVYGDNLPARNQWNGKNQIDSYTGGDNKYRLEPFSKDKNVEPLTRYSDRHSPEDNSKKSPTTRFSELHEEYLKLQLLYNSRGQELEDVKREELRAKENFEHELNSQRLRLNLIEGEKDRLSSSLQEAQKLISQFQHDNDVLKGKLNAVEFQLSSEKDAKVAAQGKLQSAEVTVQSLEQQISLLTHSENAVRLQQQNKSIVRDLKLRHQKEVLQMKEKIDKLQEHLSSKINESDRMSSTISQLQRKCEDLQIQKGEIFNKLSANLEASQREYKNLLESGAIAEVAMTKIQVQHLQEEKSKMEKQNSALKEEIKSLEGELKTYEALKITEQQPEKNKKAQSSKRESDLKIELQKSLRNNQSLRTQNQSLKEKFDELKHKMPVSEEKAKFYESRYQESEAKLRELQKKLEEVSPAGSIPMSQHKLQVGSLEEELRQLQRRHRDITEKYEGSSTNEEKFSEENKRLRTHISEMMKDHKHDKIKALELCRQKYLEIHQSAIEKLKEDLASKDENELKEVSRNYENKISELKKEIKLLNDRLYDSKNQYVKIYGDYKSLQSKLDPISKHRQRTEIEKELSAEHEKKLLDMQEQLQKQKTEFESLLETEIKKVQEQWTKEKMVEIKGFVQMTKQRLDEEFVKCLEMEKNKYQAKLNEEKDKILKECSEKIAKMEVKHEIEKSSLNARLIESFQSRWKNDMEKNHQAQIESIKKNFEDQIADLESEIKVLKEKNVDKSELKAEITNLNLRYEDRINYLKQQNEAEKKNLQQKFQESFQSKWKRDVEEMQYRHQAEIESIKQKFENKVAALEIEIKVLKEENCDKSELNAEREKLNVEYQEKVNHLKQQYQTELNSVTAKLRENFQLKRRNEITEMEQSHQTEIADIQKMYEEKIQVLQSEMKILRENHREKQTWEIEKLDFMKNEHLLKDKLSNAYEIEKRFTDKIKKYHSSFASLKTKYRELQRQDEDLKKSVEDKERQLRLMKDKHDQSKQKEEEQRLKTSMKDFGTQTEEQVIPKKIFLNVYDMFVKCFQKITEDIKTYMSESSKHTGEHIRKALRLYHDHLSGIYQDALKEACSPSNFCIPVIKQNFQPTNENFHSPNIAHSKFNPDLIPNSTPVDVLSSGDPYKKLDYHMKNVSNLKLSQNSRSPPPPIRFEDVSFDFLPLSTHDFGYTSVKFPDSALPQGLFQHRNILHSFPERDPPTMHVK